MCPRIITIENFREWVSLTPTSRFRIAELDRATRYLRGPHLQQGAKQPGFVTQLLELAGLHKEEGDYSVRLAHMYVSSPYQLPQVFTPIAYPNDSN